MIDPANNGQLPSRQRRGRKGTQEIELPLLGNQSTDGQHVSSWLQSELDGLFTLLRNIRKHDAVRYHLTRLAILGPNEIAYAAADSDAFVGVTHPHRFPDPEHHARRPTPFLPVVVLAVMGNNHPQADGAQQWSYDCRPYAVNVHDARSSNRRDDRTNHGVKQRFEILVGYGPQPQYSDALPCLDRTRLDVRGPHTHRHSSTEFDHPWREILCVRFDTTLNLRKPRKPNI